MVTRISLFDASVQESQEWIADLARRLPSLDAQSALHGMTAVLHALRDELSATQNAALAAQMPMMLRGVFFQDWKPELSEPKHSSRAKFLQRIDAAFASYEAPPDPERLAREVFTILTERISGECLRLRRTLPADLRALWPPEEEELDEQ